jgi:hypothetical protein
MLALLVLLGVGCDHPEDVCAPVSDRIGFFSQGDCIFTRARFFRGHEWLTFFGNAELPEADRFDDGEVQWMALGNRRVDYPKELLVHLDNGILAYVEALTQRTERPEEQPNHFLLGGSDTEESAATAAREHVFEVTRRALEIFADERIRALTLLGQAQHTVQDSFSPAHTVRESGAVNYGVLPSDRARQSRATSEALDAGSAAAADGTCRGRCGCISRVKAYLRRDELFREGVLYHGTAADTIGHITSEDSIYESGRSCHRPLTREAVFGCLNASARQAVLGTMAYLGWVQNEIVAGNVGSGLDAESLRIGFDEFAEDHLSSCASIGVE